MSNPSVSIAVSDSVAVAIAGLFRSLAPSGPEGHAVRYCLIGWVKSRLHAGRHAGAS